MSANRFKILILGGGTGGIPVAARLASQFGSGQIGIVEPSEFHYYQPAWTLVGGGVYNKENTRKPEKDQIPAGCTWIRDSVKQVVPKENRVLLNSGKEIFYDYLVVATGLRLNWESVKGLEGHLGRDGIGSIYEYDQCDRVRDMLYSFNGGTAIFVMPPVPIKCAGAPQKIMYLADEIFRERHVREKSTIVFASAGTAIFGVPEFAKTLNEVLKRKEIETWFSRRLLEVRPDQKIAVFEHLIEQPQADGSIKTESQIEERHYDFLHVVPTMSAHAYVSESGLAFTQGPHKGWLKTDMHTLQHLDYLNIFGVGDVTGLPNSKTGAAVRKQAPLVVANLLAVMEGRKPVENYDGYSSCPLVTSKHSVILAEFGYDGKLLPSFPVDPTKERYSMWILKRYLLPEMYWHGMLKGRA